MSEPLAEGDSQTRDELITQYLPLAQVLARRFTNRGIPLDDLQQVASYALVQAVDRFDPAHGNEFATYATPTIVGELKRHFRDKGWAVRVPRRIQELHLRLPGVVEELSATLGRSPTIAEIATAAGASQEEVLEAMEAAGAYRSDSFDEPTPDGEPRNEPGIDDADLFGADDRVLVEGLLAELAPREQLLVRLRFYEDMTQGEIAQRLGISQMHVSRLLNRCLQELRRRADGADG